MPATVAIIMRAKNEMPHVVRALAALKTQTFQNFALFPVDSGSTDGTLEALPNPEQIPPEEYIPGRVLNNTIANTAQSVIVLLNADAVPQSDDWLEKLVEPIFQNRSDATFSRQVARPDAKFVVAYDYTRAYSPGKTGPDFFSAVACAFKRGLWEKYPFPAEGYAEDAAWAKRQVETGAMVTLISDSVVEHSHNYSLRDLYRKRYRQALTFGDPPNLPLQIARCFREITRDFFYALSRFKLHTVPYNIAYRITIHRAIYRGLKEGKK